tara:strand:+ start:189 stop:806 length:618 start_codon:yes stop_codon:yes gene_type:complete
MPLSQPVRSVVEAEIGSSETISYGDLVLLQPEFAGTSGSPAVDDLSNYVFKYTARRYDSSPAMDASEPGIFGVVAGKVSTMAADGTGKLSAGDAGDTISVVIGGFAMANVHCHTVNLTKDAMLYVGDLNIGSSESAGMLVTSVARSNAANQLSNTLADALSDAAHTQDYFSEVRAKSLVTTAVTAGTSVFAVAPVLVYNNPLVVG